MPIYFGGLNLPDEAATSHFMIVGTTGSGKTLTLRMMMGSVLPEILCHLDRRAVIFDVKQEMVSILAGMKFPDERLCLLNPFDSRCFEWNMAADITGPDTALQLATILIPEEDSQSRYFSDAARDLLAGVIKVFIDKGVERWERSGKKPAWRLADLVYTLRSTERLKHVLSQSEEGLDLVGLHLENERTSKSIVSTARTRLQPFEVVAALWKWAGDGEPNHELPHRRRSRKISLKTFLKGNGILILGNNQTALAPIQAINRVIFQRLTELVLDQKEDDDRRTWFFLDEVRKLGKLEGLDDLMTNGRSKGACVVLGFQDIDGLRAVYGKEVAGEITSMCGSFGILKVSGASTPQWASEILGEQEVRQLLQNRSSSSNPQGHSFSDGESEQIRERKLYLPSMFRMTPLARKGQMMKGYFCSGELDSTPYEPEILPAEVNEKLPPKASSDINFHPWESENYKRIPPWSNQEKQDGSDNDFQRLNIPPLPALEKPQDGDEQQEQENKISPDDIFNDELNRETLDEAWLPDLNS